MSAQNFARCLAFVLQWEGGFVNDNTATTVQALGGTSTVNGSTSALTLTTAYKAVWLLSAGNLGSGNARFVVSQ